MFPRTDNAGQFAAAMIETERKRSELADALRTRRLTSEEVIEVMKSGIRILIPMHVLPNGSAMSYPHNAAELQREWIGLLLCQLLLK